MERFSKRELFSPEVAKTMGDIYYVKGLAPRGSDANDGLSVGTPVANLAEAIDRVEDGHDDVIVIIDAPFDDDFPIVLNKNRMHVIGVDNLNGMLPRLIPATENPYFQFPGDKSYIELAHLAIDVLSVHDAPSDPAIEILGGTEGRSRIHDCWFGWIGCSQDAITVGNDAPEFLIDHCLFGEGLTRDGIRIDSAFSRAIIRDNIFRRPAGIGIDAGIAIASHMGAIIHNKFSLPSDTKGKAISFVHADCEGALVDQNSAMFGKTLMTANPYVDDGVPGNDWGCNYAQCGAKIDAVITEICRCLMPTTTA